MNTTCTRKTKKQTEAGCIGLQEKKLFKKLYQERNKWTNDARAGQRICPLPWMMYL